MALTWFHCVLCLVSSHLEVTPSSDSQSSFPCTAQVSRNLSRLGRKQRATVSLFGSTVISFHHEDMCLLLTGIQSQSTSFFIFAEMGSINFHAPSWKTLFPSPHLMTHVVEGIGDGSAWKRVFCPSVVRLAQNHNLVTSTVLIVYSSAKGQGNRIVGIYVYSMEEQSMSSNILNTVML